MKLIIIFVLILATIGYSQTAWYASPNGDDSDGKSWATAHDDIGDMLAYGISAGDTIFTTGALPAFAIYWSGSNGNPIVICDSLSMLAINSGVAVNDLDTTQVGSTIISFSGVTDGIAGATRDYIHLIGLTIRCSAGATTSHYIDLFTGVNPMHGWDIRKCWFKGDNYASGSGVIALNSDDLVIIGNRFTGTMGNGISTATSADNLVIQNNTFVGNFANNNVLLISVGNTGELDLRNNIVHNTSGTSTKQLIVVGLPEGGDTFVIDNNIWYEASLNNPWQWNSQNIATFAEWQDSVQVYDVDGETNSLNVDPEVQNLSTTCYILKNSPATDAGIGLGYSNDIGWFKNSRNKTPVSFKSIFIY